LLKSGKASLLADARLPFCNELLIRDVASREAQRNVDN
jgi:hypothetical protein